MGILTVIVTNKFLHDMHSDKKVARSYLAMDHGLNIAHRKQQCTESMCCNGQELTQHSISFPLKTEAVLEITVHQRMLFDHIHVLSV